MESKIDKIVLFVELLVLIVIIGIVGYIFIEGYTPINALYMTVITISTVGFGEVSELSSAGKVFTVFMIFSGITVGVYGLSSITTFLIEGELKKYIKDVKMKKKIYGLDGHYIICGVGETGSKIVEKLKSIKKDFVIIEKDEKNIEEIKSIFGDSVFIIKGDATKDEVLKEAGLEKASVLIGTLSSDAENVFLSLTAKDINPKIRIVTKAIDSSAEKKLLKAGADHIISPIDIAVNRIVSTATNPDVVNFLDVVTKVGEENLKLEMVKVEKGSKFQGVELKEAKIPSKTNLIVIGIKKENGITVNPMSNTIIEFGDGLIVLGNDKQIEVLKLLVK